MTATARTIAKGRLKTQGTGRLWSKAMQTLTLITAYWAIAISALGPKSRRIRTAERAVSMMPDSAKMRQRYGVLLFRARRFRDAASEFVSAARLEPNDATGFHFLARALIQMGMSDPALTAARLAVKADSTNRRAILLLKRLSANAPDSVQADAAELTVLPQASAPQWKFRPLLTRRLRAVRRLVAVPSGSIQNDFEFDYAPAPRRGLREYVTDQIDAFISFLNLERSLILRNIAAQSTGSIIAPFSLTIQLILAIAAHSVLFWAMMRDFPGQISYLFYNIGGFATWFLFSYSRFCAVPFLGRQPVTKSANIKWLNLAIADAVLILIKIFIAVPLVIFGFWIFGFSELAGDHFSINMLLYMSVMLLTLAMGIGLGMVFHALNARWPMIATTEHLFMWIMFFTSGVYEPYVSMPDFAQPYFKLNPVLALVEYSRSALDSTYPVDDLTLAYPVLFAASLIALGMVLRSLEKRTRSA